ncbi:MAG: DUF1040 family protein [Comamonadaceae bacterium]|nr:MAG: DUF1040 family protein [Comamonadaceae bacterium]
MRDPHRIHEVLAALKRIWELEPDLRLGQLVVNAARPAEPCPEIFHLEDDKLLEGLLRYEHARHGAGNAS